MWWCWANRMMVLGKKWWKTNPIEVFAYQTRSFLRMKIACSHNNGDMIPMSQHLRRRILAPETRTPLASNLCATSPCEKCGERCPRQWEWKIHGKIHRNLFRLFPELTFNRLWFLVSIESQTRWEASESRGLDLYHVLACVCAILPNRGGTCSLGPFRGLLWDEGGGKDRKGVFEFWYSMVSGSESGDGGHEMYIHQVPCSALIWVLPQHKKEKKCSTLLLGGRPPSRPGLKPNFASTAHSCTSKGQTSW